MRGLLILIILTCAACAGRKGATGRTRAGTISVSWNGTLRGSLRDVPATARWCPTDTLLEVIATRNDTSFGFALLARDTLRSELYGATEMQDFNTGRPQAYAGLRILSESTLLGFDAKGGQIRLTTAGAEVTGTVDLRMRRTGSTDSLKLSGLFGRIPVVRATGFCGRANKPGGG